MATSATPEDISAIGSLLRPKQTIAIDKLIAQAKELHLGRDKVYAIKREMMRRGMMTEHRRSKAPSLVTFHNPPLPESQRQRPIEKTTRRRDATQPTTTVTDADRIERLTAKLRQRELKIRDLEAEIRDIKAQLQVLLS